MVPDAKASLALVASLAPKFPAFERGTEYIGLRTDDEYAFYDGDIASTDTGLTPVDEYLSITNEFVVPHSTSKHCRHARSSYFVGALGRFNNNFDKLNPLARQAAGTLGLEPVVQEPLPQHGRAAGGDGPRAWRSR